MQDDARHDLLLYYARYYRPGAIDLSSSSPPAPLLGLPVERAVPPQDLGYVPPTGAAELRELIAARYATLAAGDILLTAGASEALAAVAFAVVGRGHCVAHDRGTYPSFLEAARTAGARLRLDTWPRRGDRVAAICHPTAPDGRLFDIVAWAEAAVRAGAVPLADEVYRDLGHDGAAVVSAADACEGAVGIGGLSKTLGMGGLRVGWIATRDASLGARLDRQLQLLSGGPASLSVVAATAAMRRFDIFVWETLKAMRANAPAVYAVLAAAGWHFERPQAGLTLEARPPLRPTPQDEERVRAAGYFLIPCDMYGAPGCYRISLLADAGALRRALAILQGGDEGVAGRAARPVGEAAIRPGPALAYDGGRVHEHRRAPSGA